MKRLMVSLSGQGAYCQTASLRLEIGQEVGPAPEDYFRRFGQTGYFQVLERFRPSHLLSHRDAVVMHDSIDALENIDEGEWLHELQVQADATVQRHDVFWANRIAVLMAGEPHRTTPALLRDAAERYWCGHASEDPVWEYLTGRAIVVASHRLG